MNIPEVIDQFKGTLRRVPEEYITVAILVLVALTSFGLGRLSVLEPGREPVRIISPEQTNKPRVVGELPSSSQMVGTKDAAVLSNAMEGGEVVASKNGTKYHLPWCSGAKRITAANKITFETAQEAEKAGYTPAANCPGL